jgi:hypothetical protein
MTRRVIVWGPVLQPEEAVMIPPRKRGTEGPFGALRHARHFPPYIVTIVRLPFG